MLHKDYESNCSFKKIAGRDLKELGTKTRRGRQKLVVRQSLASKDLNTEAKGATALEAVSRQPSKAQQTEKD
jgi:hypothetical protein